MTLRKYAVIIFSVTLLGSLISIPSAQAAQSAKLGAVCAKAGQKQTVSGKKFTCVKSGTKNIWKSSSETTTNFTFNTLCDTDPGVPADWAKYQQFAKKTFGCARPYRFLDVALPAEKPKTELTPIALRASTSECKIPEQENNFNNTGHRLNGWKFNGDVQIQVIPVEFTDFKATASPEKEYGKYLTYIKDMFYKLSDGNTRITFRTPKEYIKTGASLQSFVIPGEIVKNNGRFKWKNIDTSAYQKAVYTAADAVIDFKDIDLAIVIVPFSVPAEFIPHNQGYRMDNVSTSEGLVEYNYLMPPATEVNDMSWSGVEPFLHLHEIFHSMGILNDHDGDDMGRAGPNLGTGMWGHMSGMQTDFLIWDKWLAGMIKDSQVICARANETSVNWIKPGGIFGNFEKVVVVPLSNTKVIVIESMRAAGINFKLPVSYRGALVYVVDAASTAHAGGINVIRPSQRTGSVNGPYGFVLADAPLKNGESLTVEGHKITVVESGAFGDVVKVEKAG